MALHPELPRSPYAALDPAHRWFPADEALRSTAYEQLLPPLVARIRTEVKTWELDLPCKMQCLAQWCDDATAASRAQGGPAYRFAYVDQQGLDRHPPASLAELATMFREYQPAV